MNMIILLVGTTLSLLIFSLAFGVCSLLHPPMISIPNLLIGSIIVGFGIAMLFTHTEGDML